MVFQHVLDVNKPDLCGAGHRRVADDGQQAALERHAPTAELLHGGTDTFLTQDLFRTLRLRGVEKLYMLYGLNRDSGSMTRTVPEFEGIDSFQRDDKRLHPLLTELRVIMTPKESQMLRIANLLSPQAQGYVMRRIRAGLSELQLEALFKSWCQFHGCA